MLNVKSLLSLATVLIISVPALAVDTPSDLAGASLVTAERAKALIDSGAKIYDVRAATEYIEEHIKGSINLPYKENSKKEAGFDSSLDKFKLDDIGSDKNASVIFQCNGAECWKSYKASVIAVKAGYKKVFWFRGGIPEWKTRSFPTEK
ncbi:thiosulfate:cyanide sulfurtransferase [compost metagenome]